MTNQAKENLFQWIKDGLMLPDVELIYDTMSDYFKDGSEYFKRDKDKRNEAQFKLYLLVQALAWLRDLENRKDLEFLLNHKIANVVALQEWKSKKHLWEGKSTA